MMKFLSATLSAMVVVASGFVASAQAEVSVQGIADNLAANGFTNVEVKVGATQGHGGRREQWFQDRGDL